MNKSLSYLKKLLSLTVTHLRTFYRWNSFYRFHVTSFRSGWSLSRSHRWSSHHPAPRYRPGACRRWAWSGGADGNVRKIYSWQGERIYLCLYVVLGCDQDLIPLSLLVCSWPKSFARPVRSKKPRFITLIPAVYSDDLGAQSLHSGHLISGLLQGDLLPLHFLSGLLRCPGAGREGSQSGQCKEGRVIMEKERNF